MKHLSSNHATETSEIKYETSERETIQQSEEPQEVINDKETKTDGEFFECSKCSRAFITEKILINHARTHKEHQSGKKPKKAVTLEVKLEVLRRCDAGEKAVDISRTLGLAPTTIRTIRDRDAAKIRQSAIKGTPLNAKLITRNRSAIMTEMEALLSIWIREQLVQNIVLNKAVIQTKAKELFEGLKKQSQIEHTNSTTPLKEENFEASLGWFKRFKIRANLYRISLKDDPSIEAQEQTYDPKDDLMQLDL